MKATLSAQELIQLAVNGQRVSYAVYSRAAEVAGFKQVKRLLTALHGTNWFTNNS